MVEAASGWIYTANGFVEGSVTWADGRIVEVSRRCKRNGLRGIILPGLANAHTHLADGLVREELRGGILDLVAPGGLKHQALAAASGREITAAIGSGLDTMFRSGTTWCADFREGGVPGVRQMITAKRGRPVGGLILGRPSVARFDRKELAAILRVADGVAVSAISDWPRDALEAVAFETRRAGKVFALHASERVREDIDAVLDLKPAFLVHMVQATRGDLARVADADVPVVVCPRSNLFFGLVPDIPRLLSAGIRVFLGTDNAMVSTPSMLREIETAYKVARLKGEIAAANVVSMAVGARNAFTGGGATGLTEGDPADLVVLDLPPGDPAAGMMRATGADVALVTARGRTWRRDRAAKAVRQRSGSR